MHGGTIVDATIISAPSSTKNAEKKRDPEMYQTKKEMYGNSGWNATFGDSGYIEIEKRDEIKNNEHFRKIDFRINRRPKSLPQVSDHAIDWERYIENRKSASFLCSLRAKFYYTRSHWRMCKKHDKYDIQNLFSVL